MPRNPPLYSIVIALHPVDPSPSHPKVCDYRLGDLSISWIDYHNEKEIVLDGEAKDEASSIRNAPAALRRTPSSSSTTVLADKGTPLSPERRQTQGVTELGPGTLHLFKHSPPLSILETLEADLSHDADVCDQYFDEKEGSSTATAEGEDGTLIAILAVPKWMGTKEFAEWLGPWTTCLEGWRIISDISPNKTLGLLKFRDAQEANDFVSIYLGRNFHPDQIETSHLLRIHHLVVQNLTASISSPSRPARYPSERPLCAAVNPRLTPASLLREIPPRSIVELPTCPVCLERLDSAVTGLVTTPCSHVFNCKCLEKWKWSQDKCPTCHHSKQRFSHKPNEADGKGMQERIPMCFACDDEGSPNPENRKESTKSNWICLICGYIGCNRYQRGHAREHGMNAGHVFAMEIETQRVWDYLDDSYVHRLIQNQSDGKLVELPGAASLANHAPSPPSLLPLEAALSTVTSGTGSGNGPSLTDEKKMSDIEKITLEYSYILSGQLEQQKKLHEAELRITHREIKELRQKVAEGEEWRKRFIREEEKRKVIETGRIPGLEQDKLGAEKKAQKMSDLAKKLADDLKTERAMSSGLMEKNRALQTQLEASAVEKRKDQEKIEELEEMIKDLMATLETREKVAQAGEGAQVVIQQGPTFSSSSSSSRNARRKKK